MKFQENLLQTIGNMSLNLPIFAKKCMPGGKRLHKHEKSQFCVTSSIRSITRQSLKIVTLRYFATEEYNWRAACKKQVKWLFRPKFFSSSKWAQFLHVTLDLTGKRCPVIFSAVLFFVSKKFSSTSTVGKCALRWFYCLEEQKLSLERTPPGKNCVFAYVICGKWKRN